MKNKKWLAYSKNFVDHKIQSRKYVYSYDLDFNKAAKKKKKKPAKNLKQLEK